MGDVRGIILKSNGKPTTTGFVRLEDTSHGANCDDDGSFIIRCVPAGYYTLIASAEYYKSSRVGNITVNPCDTPYVRVVLERDPNYEEPRISRGIDWVDFRPPDRKRRYREIKGYADTLRIEVSGVEFSAYSVISAKGDTTQVTVVAQIHNISRYRYRICGKFAFVPDMCRGVLVPGERSDTYDYLPIGSYYTTPGIECDRVRLGPNEILKEKIQFVVPSRRIRSVKLWCLFFFGKPWSRWEDTDYVDIGKIDFGRN
jgi:hypothetical protein